MQLRSKEVRPWWGRRRSFGPYYSQGIKIFPMKIKEIQSLLRLKFEKSWRKKVGKKEF